MPTVEERLTLFYRVAGQRRDIRAREHRHEVVTGSTNRFPDEFLKMRACRLDDRADGGESPLQHAL